MELLTWALNREVWFGNLLLIGQIQCLQTQVKTVCSTAFSFPSHAQTISTSLWALITVGGERSRSILPLISMRCGDQMKVLLKCVFLACGLLSTQQSALEERAAPGRVREHINFLCAWGPTTVSGWPGESPEGKRWEEMSFQVEEWDFSATGVQFLTLNEGTERQCLPSGQWPLPLMEGKKLIAPLRRAVGPSFWNQAGVLISSAKWLWRDPFV